MSATIYYFSGTGNSLAVSKKLTGMLSEKSKILAIPSVDGKNVTIQSDIIGIVFPVYFHNIPGIVKQFLQKMEFITSPYIFAVATCNSEPGHSLFAIKKLVAKKSQSLSLGIAINMPGNALITEMDIEQERLLESTEKVAEIASYINQQKKKPIDGDNCAKEHIKSTIVSVLAKHVEFTHKRYKVSNTCTACGLCEKVCPVNNIELIHNIPKRKKNCTNCLACFHWCPNEAIYMENMTIKNRRKYHHPEISMNEMFLR